MDMELGLKIKKTREASKSIKLNKDSIPVFTTYETKTLYILVGYLSGRPHNFLAFRCIKGLSTWNF